MCSLKREKIVKTKVFCLKILRFDVVSFANLEILRMWQNQEFFAKNAKKNQKIEET
jgi:hypothetical protein